MTKQRRNRNSFKKQKRISKTGTNVNQDTSATQQTESPDESNRLWQEEMSSGVSEDTAYESSSAATGGGVDTPTAVEKSTEAAIRKRKPINQGSSVYTGGGASNGTNL